MIEKPTCVVHIDENGNQEFLICGDARLLVIDEGAPHDRVYEVKETITHKTLAILIGDSPIGSKDDDRHEAIAARVLADMRGKRRFEVVSSDGRN